jgi:putative effector of murein hydrolase
VTLAIFLQPAWLAVLLGWNFAVLSAAQLTIRLIMAYSVRTTLLGAVVLTAIALVVAAVYDLVLGNQASLSARLTWAPLPMILMGLAGFCVGRWLLRIKRVRGQVIAGLMVGLLDPHLFTLL